RVEIVAWTRLRIVLGNGVARAPNRKPCCRIVGARLPNAAATGFPRVILVLPRFASQITGFRYHVPPPQLLACPRFERRDPTARAGITGAVRNEDLVFNRDRRRNKSFFSAELVGRCDHLIPQDFARV